MGTRYTPPKDRGPKLIKVDGDTEYWQRGAALFVLPRLRADYPPELQEAIARRRIAAIEGRCPCGAVARYRHRSIDIHHEHDCPADEVTTRALHAAWVATRRTSEP